MLTIENARSSQEQLWDEVSAGEALYDQPILKPMVSEDNSHFLEPLFDDPGYNKGLGLTRQDSTSAEDAEHIYNNLEDPKEREGGEGSNAVGHGDIAEQMAATKPEMKASVDPLEMLNLLDEELKLDDLISSLIQQGDV